MFNMNKEDIAMATITWARNDDEETLLRQSLTALAELGRQIYITDAGSQSSFIDFLRTVPQFDLVTPVKGVWPQAQSSLKKAIDAGHKYILYTEPDKLYFFSYLNSFLNSQVHADDLHPALILFSRSAKAFSSFPSFQQMTETAINNCCAELIGTSIDYTYGPFILDRHIAKRLQQLPVDIGWGWRPFAFNIAKRMSYIIRNIEEDFFCPEGQNKDSLPERIYRMKQLEQNIQGLTMSVSAELNS
jgi:hypothetical protein